MTQNIPEIYGSLVFNDRIMRSKLPKDMYKALKKTIENGTHLELDVANSVAVAMKEWAIEKGATHYTHWFQPLTGVTAEKHDSFITAPMENGKVLEVSASQAKITGTVPSGRVLVDGLGVGDVGNIVLRDRKHLAQDGLIVVVLTMEHESKTVVAGPDIISRGFVYVRESEDLMESMRLKAVEIVDDCLENNTIDWATLKSHIKNELGSFIFSKTKRKPMILPVIMDV